MESESCHQRGEAHALDTILCQKVACKTVLYKTDLPDRPIESIQIGFN